MKKIFTLSMMVATVLGMSAATLQRQGEIKIPSYPTAKTINKAENVLQVGKMTPKKSVRKAATTEEDIIGEWTLTAYSFADGANIEYEMEIAPSTNAGKLVITNFLGASPEATFDAENGELHIPYQRIGYSDMYSEDIYIANTYISEEGTGLKVTIDEADIVLYLEGDNFLFDNAVGFWGEEISANTSYGVWDQGIMTPGRNWDSIGEATYTDWLCVSLINFGGQVVPTSVKVEAQRHRVDRNYYRLIAPYYDWIGTLDNMEFIILDDGMVKFPFQYFCTFKNTGPAYWASLNYIYGVGEDAEGAMTIEEFDRDYPDCNIYFDAEKKLIEIGKVVPSVQNGSQLVLAYPDEWVGDDQPLYLLKFDDGIPTGSIQFDSASISNIMSNDPNAPVEYFNIMGQRVLNPTAGQLLIRRQGSDATKIVF